MCGLVIGVFYGGSGVSVMIVGLDGKLWCCWCVVVLEFLEYYDMEWGFLVWDDVWLFEKLCFEGF